MLANLQMGKKKLLHIQYYCEHEPESSLKSTTRVNYMQWQIQAVNDFECTLMQKTTVNFVGHYCKWHNWISIIFFFWSFGSLRFFIFLKKLKWSWISIARNKCGYFLIIPKKNYRGKSVKNRAKFLKVTRSWHCSMKVIFFSFKM